MWLRPYHRNFRKAADHLMTARQVLRGNIEPENGTIAQSVGWLLGAAYQPVLSVEREALALAASHQAPNYSRNGGVAVRLEKPELDATVAWVQKLEPLFARAMSRVDDGEMDTIEVEVDEIIEVLADADDWAMEQYCRVCEGDHARSFDSPF